MSTTIATTAKRSAATDAIMSLELVARDLEMFISGEWVPDEDSAQASLDNVQNALNVLKDLLADSGG